MSVSLSVIICTHNPRGEYLAAVLRGLQDQTLAKELWELVIVDNASAPAIVDSIDLRWHLSSRIVREETLGLTRARLKGIGEAQGELLVFVDDDNILDADYLETAFRIGSERPYIGAWGGHIRPQFEVEPPRWTKPFWSKLAVRTVLTDRWSNFVDTLETVPCGGGMCVRRRVASVYAESIEGDDVRLMLDRRGSNLSSSGDSDLALTACDIGVGTGLFKDLKLTHLIPRARLREKYLLSLVEAMAYTGTLLFARRGRIVQPPHHAPFRRQLGAVRRLVTMHPRSRRFLEARLRGEMKGIHEACSWHNASDDHS